MSNCKSLGSSVTNTRMRTPENLSEFSGMCSVCTSACIGTCEIGLSALRGTEAIYPFATDTSQFASEKNYPLDFSHFNINGKVFSAKGCEPDSEVATYTNVNLDSTFGKKNKVKLKAPIVLPAIAKLNWKDYYSGAALAGVVVVIGEDVVSKDKKLVIEKGKVSSSPLLEEMVAAFRAYDHGYGDIILQANVDDENLGVLEYAIQTLKVKSVELKFGQAAKGIQGIGRLKSLEEALKFHGMGYMIFPDPTDPVIAENYEKGIGQEFEKIGKLPMWDEAYLVRRVRELRELGAERVCFKTGPFDPEDLLTILKTAAVAGVDLVTLDGAGGGTGNSPVKMMNEWGIPTVYLECIVYKIMAKLEALGFDLPQVALAGGFAMEDQVFKGLALGAPYVSLIAIGRAAMAAANVGKLVGELIQQGKLPKEFERFGTTTEEIFEDIRKLKVHFGEDTASISTGAIGVYSYLQRITTGLQQLMALNRKFSLENIEREDIVPLTELAVKVTGLKTYDDILKIALDKL